ncbi:TetR/AcrR family transcriptional regulator [Acetobacter sicerae]|uniref:TetR/AcrR family transcriptional regulator n=1 Tax=Acetobacter sicerae TaxID=85325 RepID=A0ABS8VVB1_9PROT|nr:TetR/AcrR family transcriptional regulator [Acetobacter sicerae]MCE0744925.1 TetR/AcrR family transcriptional regulator [Acetobacter sicerae]
MKDQDTCSPRQSGDASSAKREQILKGAHEIFAEYGYEGASMSVIARHAGVSKGTLYNYFDNKAELFTAVVKQKAERDLPAAFHPVNAHLPPRETLHALARSTIALIIAPTALALYRVIISEARHFPHLAQTFWEHAPAICIDTLARWLTERTEKNELNVPDPMFAAEQFYTLCQTRIVTRRRFELPVSTTDADIDRIADTTVTMFLAVYSAS